MFKKEPELDETLYQSPQLGDQKRSGSPTVLTSDNIVNISVCRDLEKELKKEEPLAEVSKPKMEAVGSIFKKSSSTESPFYFIQKRSSSSESEPKIVQSIKSDTNGSNKKRDEIQKLKSVAVPVVESEADQITFVESSMEEKSISWWCSTLKARSMPLF